jgi:hypothetical protein
VKWLSWENTGFGFSHRCVLGKWYKSEKILRECFFINSHRLINNQRKSGSMAELANLSVIHLRDTGSNLRTDKNIFWFCLHWVWILICRELTLEHHSLKYIYFYWQTLLDPTRHVAKKPLTTICLWRGTIQKWNFIMYWFNSQCLIHNQRKFCRY